MKELLRGKKNNILALDNAVITSLAVNSVIYTISIIAMIKEGVHYSPSRLETLVYISSAITTFMLWTIVIAKYSNDDLKEFTKKNNYLETEEKLIREKLPKANPEMNGWNNPKQSPQEKRSCHTRMLQDIGNSIDSVIGYHANVANTQLPKKANVNGSNIEIEPLTTKSNKGKG